MGSWLVSVLYVRFNGMWSLKHNFLKASLPRPCWGQKTKFTGGPTPRPLFPSLRWTCNSKLTPSWPSTTAYMFIVVSIQCTPETDHTTHVVEAAQRPYNSRDETPTSPTTPTRYTAPSWLTLVWRLEVSDTRVSDNVCHGDSLCPPSSPLSILGSSLRFQWLNIYQWRQCPHVFWIRVRLVKNHSWMDTCPFQDSTVTSGSRYCVGRRFIKGSLLS